MNAMSWECVLVVVDSRGQHLLVPEHNCNGEHGQSENHFERSTQNCELLQLMRVEKSLV
jgi:hypothetical protein